jgi:ATP/maltotriose-dependent transcriptional regulator MalT/DNA-binding SARP family transcriptional activator
VAVLRIAKITRPILPEVYPRKRFFDVLDSSRKRPLTWIAGPPGCGKTTTVINYLDARKLPCLWYQVDPGDADPASFFYYLGLAAQKTAPRNRNPLPLLTREYLQGIPTFTLRYFENLFDRLKIPSVVVFDNYQEVPEDAPLHEIILNSLSRLPEGIHVFLVSRKDPPPVFMRLRANYQMETLGWNDLRLTLQESAGIIRLRSKAKESKENISRLHNATDGWVAGLILMLEGAREKGTGPLRIGEGSPEEIFAYFASEIFGKTDRDIQDFLLKTAFLPKMTPKMAEELTSLSSAARVLSGLSRTHYFTEKSFEGEAIYQYHPLFRDFLLSRATESFPAEDRWMTATRAAEILEKDGQTESAVNLLCEIGNWEELVRLIRKEAPRLISQGRNRILEEWLKGLPQRMLEKDSWLLYWMGAALTNFNPSLGESFFERAFKGFREDQNETGVFMAWSGIVSSIIAGVDDYKRLDRWFSALEDLMPFFQGVSSKTIHAGVASAMFQGLYNRQPSHPEIETWEQRVLSSLEDHDNVDAKILALYRLAHYRLFRGDFERGGFYVTSLQRLADSVAATPFAKIRRSLIESIYYRFTGSYEKCLDAVTTGLELSMNSGVHIQDIWLLTFGVSSALNVGDTTTAERLLERVASMNKVASLDWWTYHQLRSREALSRGDPKQALFHIDLAFQFGKNLGVPSCICDCHLVKSYALHRLGKYRESEDHLAHASQIASQMKSKLFGFYTFLARALFALDQRDDSSGILALEKAFTLGREGSYFTAIIDRPSSLAKLCIKALEVKIEVEYAQQLIRKLNIIPEKPHLSPESWPWPVKVYTLGRFAVLVDGNAAHSSRKVQQKPLAVLRALIALGGREVSEDEIMDNLWPEADGDLAQQSFASALHRLRQLLRCEKAIQRQDGKLTLDDRFCWVDALAFETALKQAEGLWKKERLESAVQLLEKALQMFKGPFLAQETERPWTLSMRERLRGKFFRNIEKLGKYWQQSNQWEKALDCYLKGLEVDDLAEDFYLGVITCYQQLGRKNDALAAYKRYQRILSSVSGLEPSSRMEGLYKSLAENREAQK